MSLDSPSTHFGGGSSLADLHPFKVTKMGGVGQVSLNAPTPNLSDNRHRRPNCRQIPPLPPTTTDAALLPCYRPS
jgi:hypothetical protein